MQLPVRAPSTIIETLIQRKYLQILTIILVLVTGANFLYHGIIIPGTQLNMDFRVYYRWAELFRLDGWYLREIKTPEPHFYYPPFWGMVLHPLTFVSYDVAKLIWQCINVCLVAGFILLTFHWLNELHYEKVKQRWIQWFLIIVALAYAPVCDTIRGGQVNLLLLLLLSLSFYFYRKDRKWWSGVLLGIASMTKLVPILLIGYWFWKKEYQIIIVTILTISIATLFTLLLYGPETHLAYIKGSAIYSRYVLEHWDYQANVSFYSFLRELQLFGFLPKNLPAVLVHYLFAGVCCFLLLLVVTRQKPSWVQLGFEYCAALTLIPLILSYTEPHHFTWLLLGYIFAIIYAAEYTSLPAKGLLAVSWLLVNIGYAVDDLTSLGGSVIGMRHIHFLGIVFLYIALLLILAEFNRKKVKERIDESI
ncbi:MAG: DUF2029 domain-containing protein [bacterium]|nr:DUF2029 domain-containing protein [bacterium]